MGKKKLLGCVCLLAVAVIMIYGEYRNKMAHIRQEACYAEAEQLIAEADYAGALEKLQSLNDEYFRYTGDLIKLCEAQQLYADGEIEEARKCLQGTSSLKYSIEKKHFTEEELAAAAEIEEAYEAWQERRQAIRDANRAQTTQSRDKKASEASQNTRKNQTSSKSTSKRKEDVSTDFLDAYDYNDPEDFYYDNYEDFDNYEDAEDYWQEQQE